MPTSIDPLPKDDEVECANCGGYFYCGLSRCPHCGVNVYEPEMDEEVGEEGPIAINRGPERGLLYRILRLFRRLFGGGGLAEELFQIPPERAELYEDLLRKVGHDPQTAERLIDLESRRAPEGTRTEWIRSALWRWERDNR